MVQRSGMAAGDTATAAPDATVAGNRLDGGRAERAPLLRRRPQALPNTGRRCSGGQAMIRLAIGATVLAAAATAFLLAPISFGASQRRALAVKAVQLGAVQLGAGLLRPLAKAGDAIAQNDLGVLLY